MRLGRRGSNTVAVIVAAESPTDVFTDNVYTGRTDGRLTRRGEGEEEGSRGAREGG